MTTFIEHVTGNGERWDQIANRYYGDPTKYERIIAANPSVAIVPTLEAGLRLSIPVDEVAIDVITVGLPPWKR